MIGSDLSLSRKGKWSAETLADSQVPSNDWLSVLFTYKLINIESKW